MLERGMIETGARRVGAEQEMALVDASGRPAAVATDVLAHVDDARFTPELALFNLEANLPPMRLGGTFLRQLEDGLLDVVQRAEAAAAEAEARVLLTGILPTLRRDDLGLHNMTPLPRYRRLNDALLSLGDGKGFPIFIRGVDEVELRPDSVMFESANTSFQLHLQVEPGDFARLYNLAQLITAPLLAAAVNSPLLFGRRLWQETRVALFERSVDARSNAERARGGHPRVTFGSGWVQSSVVELFQEAAARFPAVITCEPDPPALEVVRRGEAPKLSSLLLHNGTVWRWNRACYGVANGVAHLRIENRILPSGPTVIDEVANAALFYGLMVGLGEVSETIPSRLDFSDAKGNFITAARQGLGAQLTWLDGRRVGAQALLLDELIPAARTGLRAIEVPEEDIERYLGIVEARIDVERTGARWLLDAVVALGPVPASVADAARLTQTMLARQTSGEPVHCWPVPAPADSDPRQALRTVGDIMSTDVFTVRPQDVVDLATSVMDWKNFRHVPVETANGDLVGLVSHRTLLRLQRGQGGDKAMESVSVESIMERDLHRVSPDLPLLEALEQLLEVKAGCLLVVSEERLVGIATGRDFLRATKALLDRTLDRTG